MIAPQAFQVLTEFRFDIGEAVASSKTLQNAVGGISQAADNTLISFQKLGMGLVAQMGLGTGSILSILGTAIQASDKFGQSQRSLANIFTSNGMFGGAEGFEDAMKGAAVSMEEIRKIAAKFSLPASDLAQYTKLIGANLISSGQDNSSLKKSIDLSRGYLKSAPILGIDPSMAQGELLSMIQGRASMQERLFYRMTSDMAPMRAYRGNPSAFNALTEAKRIDVLRAAFGQFGNNTKAVEANANSLNGQMQRLKDSFIGMYSILKPIGDVILMYVLPTFHKLNDFFQKQGMEVSKSIAKLMHGILGDPESIITNLLQARRMKSDVKLAGAFAGLWGMLLVGVEILKWFGMRISVTSVLAQAAGAAFGYLKIGLTYITSIAGRLAMFLTGATTVFGAFWTIMNGIVVVASRVLMPLFLLTTLFQLISRAIAIARVDDAKKIGMELVNFSSALLKLKEAFFTLVEPFARIFDSIARGISPMFRMSNWFEVLIWMFERMSDALILFQSGFQGVVFAVLQLIENIVSLVKGSGNWNIFKGVGDAFNAGIEMKIQEIMDQIKSGDAIVNQTTNIAKVEINNQFKEQMQPDRIAFTLKEQLLKTAANRGQATGMSLAAAGAGTYGPAF